VTTEGRVLGMILMVAGVGMFGGLSGLAASFFLGTEARKPQEDTEILSRLKEIKAKLDSLQKNGPKDAVDKQSDH
jgi:hypothetical protein